MFNPVDFKQLVKSCEIRSIETSGSVVRNYCFPFNVFSLVFPNKFEQNRGFFITPTQKRHKEERAIFWRLYAEREANLDHIIWVGQKLTQFYQDTVEAVFKEAIPFNGESLYLTHISFEGWNNNHKNLMLIILPISKSNYKEMVKTRDTYS